jgi:hypothetical protein
VEQGVGQGVGQGVVGVGVKCIEENAPRTVDIKEMFIVETPKNEK